MSRRRCRSTGESHCSRVVGLGATAGAAVLFGVFGMTPLGAAPPAQADPFDVVVDSILNSVESLDPAVGTDQLFDPDAAFAATGAADGAAVPSLAADTATAGTAVPANVTVPINVNAVTEPVVDISVSGGASVPVVVDTGSNGLVIPWWDIGLDHLSLPTGLGFGGYSGGLSYFYLTLPETVTFQDGATGTGIVTTASTPVDAFIFGFPTSLSGLSDFPWTLGQFLGPADASGVLGIAPDAVGPDTSGVSAVLSALPGDLNQGVLIDEPAKELVFGPSTLPAADGITVQGVANSTLYPSIDGGPHQAVNAIIDSGGVFGTMPSSVPGAAAVAVNGAIPNGTEISVYNQNGELLYSYTTSETLVGSNGPAVISSGSMNTGYMPFHQMPVYIDLGSGGPATTFYPGAT